LAAKSELRTLRSIEMRKLMAVAVYFLLTIGSAGVCFAQTQLVTDNFAGGTSGTFLGSNWTGCGYNNGAYNKLDYQNNQAGGSGFWAQDCALYTGFGPFPGDQYGTITVVATTPSSSPQASIQLRGNATPSSPEAYIACGWDAQDFPPDYHYRVWSLAPGAPGPVSLFLSSITPAANDVIQCQILGTTVTMQVNGVTIVTVTDPSGITGGYPGLYYVDPNGTGPSPTDIIFGNFAAGSGPALVSLTITPNSATATAGSYLQFTGTASYADGTTEGLSSWSSSNTSVAIVDPSGFAYGATPGNVTITGATGPDSGTASFSVLAAQGYTPLVNDSFTGTGGGYLGANWTGCGYVGGSYSKLVYQNNQAGGSGYYSQDCAVYTGFGAFPSDQYATATVVAPIPSSTPEASIQVRANATPSSPESYIACGWDAQDFPADVHYRIWSLPPNPPTGGPTSLYLSNITPATNDVVWCQVLGTTVNMQVNGVTVATVTDTSGIVNGYPGLYYIDPTAAAPPTVDVIFDNFVAGHIDGAVLASITVTPGSATGTVGSSAQFTATGTYTDGSTANVTNLVTWSSSNTSLATVNATGLASGAGAGTVTITAASGTVSGAASFTVQGTGQMVTFTGAPASAPYNATFNVTATTNAPVMPTIAGTTGVCSVGAVTGMPSNASAVVTMLTGAGTCTVTANWAATNGFSAAGPFTQTTTATKTAPTVTFTGAPASAVYNTGFSVSATTNASTVPVITGTTNVCTVGAVTGTPASAGAAVTMISGTGICTVTATWTSDANYLAPTAKTQSTTAVKAASTVSITSNTPNPSTLSQAVSISFTAGGTGAGPTGSVRVNASTGQSCTGTLKAGSCSITFTSAGSRTLTANYLGDSNFNTSTSASVSQTVNSPTVSLNPSSINFGTVTRGSSQTQGVTVSNTGTGALINLSWSITGTNPKQFSVSSTTCGTAPASLNPGATCVINVTFAPTTTGTLTANLRLADNASNSPQTVGLTGKGQ
jgi:trimeric autotransporter adhesin